MNSPLYVLAMSAESELKSRRRVSPDSVAEAVPAPTPALDSSSTPLQCLVQPLNMHDSDNCGMLDASYLTWSPDRVNLRVDVSSASTSSRLDPFAIELIESVLSKGTGFLSQPVFPYTYGTEPLRCMVIRTHLRRRYAILPPDADQAARVAFTERLLHLWGAKLVKVCNYATPAGTTDFTTCSSSAIGSTSSSPRQEHGRNQKTIDSLRIAVSPLKRTTKVSPKADKHESGNNLSPFVVSADTSIEESSQDKAGTSFETPSRVVAVASKKALLARNCKEQKAIALHKKKQSFIGRNVRRNVRRWTSKDRQLYLEALKKHGFGATDAIRRMIPGKSYEQIQILGRAMQDDFGIRLGEGPTDEIRQCLAS